MSKWEDFKNAALMKWDKLCDWCAENPWLAITIASVTATAVGGAAKTISKQHRSRIEEKHRNLQIYDPEIGHYLDLKRPLRASEKVELAKRHTENGENITMILDDMNRLK